MSNKELKYVVLDTFEVLNIDDKINTSSKPLFFIKSKWLKKSRGQGLYDYYENTLVNLEHALIEDNTIVVKDISFKIEEKETWRIIRGTTGSCTLKAEITDKLGTTIEKVFDMSKNAKIRFNYIFEYIRLIYLYDTHNAVNKIIDLENKIKKLEAKL